MTVSNVKLSDVFKKNKAKAFKNGFIIDRLSTINVTELKHHGLTAEE